MAVDPKATLNVPRGVRPPDGASSSETQHRAAHEGSMRRPAAGKIEFRCRAFESFSSHCIYDLVTREESGLLRKPMIQRWKL